jgi:hypothetical protein
MRRKKGALKSKEERAALGALNRRFKGTPYVIHKDYPLNQVAEVGRGELSSQEFSYFQAASLDFLVCRDDDADQAFEIAIEYDGNEHEQAQQAAKDQLKDRICGEVGLPIIRIGSDDTSGRGSTTIVDFIVDHYLGEKHFAALRQQGKLSSEEEYFAQFHETTEIQRRLLRKSGLVAPIVALSFGPSKLVYWYQITDKCLERYRPKNSVRDYWRAASTVNIFRGSSTNEKVFSITREFRIRDQNPNYNVPGIHGWHIAKELAQYLCFDYIEQEWLPGD